MSYDELELDKLGDEKSALFFLISDTDTTYNFLVLPYETIVQAASGEPEAVGTVLQYYRRRIQCAARVNGRVDQRMTAAPAARIA